MIHILTLTWNGLDKLKRLQVGLKKNIDSLDCKARWYIRDNGSTDGTVNWLNDWNKSFEMFSLLVEHNRDNFAKGVNSLFDKIKSESNDDFILLLNNDIEFGDDKSLFNMMKLMNNSKIGVVGARLLYSGTDLLQHAGVIFGQRYGNMPYHYRHREKLDKDAEKNRYFQAVTAACCLIRLKAFKRMCENYFWAFEDIDLFLRIGREGWKTAYCGETKIYHEESASLKKNPVNRMFLPQNVKLFKERWFGKYKIDHNFYLSNKNYNLIK